jgi:acyl-CoA thioesterase I
VRLLLRGSLPPEEASMRLVLMIGLGVVLLVVVVAVVTAWVLRQVNRRPPNAIGAVLAAGGPPADKQVLVLVGDSITQGAVSHRWADDLASALGPDWFVVNAGTNGELAWNVVQRLDAVVQCEPDAVVVLIGTNDANASRSRALQERARKEQQLPQLPDLGWYRENLQAIIERLGRDTTARVALLSLPTIGEDPADPAFSAAERYSQVVRELARTHEVTYLPLFEQMSQQLAVLPARHTPPSREWRGVMVKAVGRHFLLKQNWDEIGNQSGFALHSDHLHLNRQGGQLVVQLVLPFVTAAAERSAGDEQQPEGAEQGGEQSQR